VRPSGLELLRGQDLSIAALAQWPPCPGPGWAGRRQRRRPV